MPRFNYNCKFCINYKVSFCVMPTKMNQSFRKLIDRSFVRVNFEAFDRFYFSLTGLSKFIWLMLSLLFTLILLYEIFKTVSVYLNNPPSSSFKTLTYDQMDFPQIYICPSHRFSNDACRNNESLIELAAILGETLKLSIFEESEKSINLEPSNIRNMNFNDLKLLWQKISGKQNQIIRQVKFRYSIESYLDVPQKSILPIFDPDYGICYLIDMFPAKQTMPGQGLTLFLTLERHLFQVRPIPYVAVPVFRGFYISVKNSLNSMNNDIFRIVSTGQYSRISIRKQKTVLDSNSQICQQYNESNFQVLRSTYSIRSCKLDCKITNFLAICQCLPAIDEHFLLKNSTNFTYCSVEKFQQCQNDIKRSENQLKSCFSNCRRPCEFFDIKTSISSNEINEQSFADYPMSNHSDSGPIWKDVAIVSIIYEQLEMQMSDSQQSMTIDDVISNLGGQVNLWMGLSMTSLIQLFSLAIFTIGYKCLYLIYRLI